MSGGGIIKGAFLIGCAAFFALLFLGAWLFKKRLPLEHPWRELSPENMLFAAQILSVALIASYFAVLIIPAL